MRFSIGREGSPHGFGVSQQPQGQGVLSAYEGTRVENEAENCALTCSRRSYACRIFPYIPDKQLSVAIVPIIGSTGRMISVRQGNVSKMF